MITCANSVANGTLPGMAAQGGANASLAAYSSIVDVRVRQHISWCVQRTTLSFVFDETDPRHSCIGLWMERHTTLLSPMLRLILLHLVPATIVQTSTLDIPVLAGEALRTLCQQCPSSVDVGILQQFYQNAGKFFINLNSLFFK